MDKIRLKTPKSLLNTPMVKLKATKTKQINANTEQANVPIPSPSGTFAAHTSHYSNPKAAKEPARPLHRDRVVLRFKILFI